MGYDNVVLEAEVPLRLVAPRLVVHVARVPDLSGVRVRGRPAAGASHVVGHVVDIVDPHAGYVGAVGQVAHVVVRDVLRYVPGIIEQPVLLRVRFCVQIFVLLPAVVDGVREADVTSAVIVAAVVSIVLIGVHISGAKASGDIGYSLPSHLLRCIIRPHPQLGIQYVVGSRIYRERSPYPALAVN